MNRVMCYCTYAYDKDADAEMLLGVDYMPADAFMKAQMIGFMCEEDLLLNVHSDGTREPFDFALIRKEIVTVKEYKEMENSLHDVNMALYVPDDYQSHYKNFFSFHSPIFSEHNVIQKLPLYINEGCKLAISQFGKIEPSLEEWGWKKGKKALPSITNEITFEEYQILIKAGNGHMVWNSVDKKFMDE